MAPSRPFHDRVLLAATCVLLATLPWLQVTSFSDTQSAPKQMVLVAVVTVGLLALWWDGIRVPRSPVLLGALAVLLCGFVAATVVSADRSVSILGWYGHRFGLLTLLALLGAFLLGAGTFERFGCRQMLIAGLVGMVLAALTAFFQEAGVGGYFASTRFADRSNGGAGSANDLAACMALGVAFLGAFPATDRRRLAGLAAATAALTFGSIASGSRLGVVAFMGAIGLALLLVAIQSGVRSRRLGLKGLAVFAGLAVGLCVALPTGSLGVVLGRYQAKAPSSVLGNDALQLGISAAIRLDLWQAAKGAAVAQPLLGHGPDTFAVEYGKYRAPDAAELERRASLSFPSAHSVVFDYAANLGVPALLALAALAGARAWSLLRQLRSGAAEVPFMLAGLGGFTAMLLANPEPIAGVPIAWLLLGSGVALRPPVWASLRVPVRAAAGAVCAGALVLVVALSNAEVLARRAVVSINTGDDVAAAADWDSASAWLPFERRYPVNRSIALTRHGVRTAQRQDLQSALDASTEVTHSFAPLAPELLREAVLASALKPGGPEAEAAIERMLSVQPHSPYWAKQAADFRESTAKAETGH